MGILNKVALASTTSSWLTTLKNAFGSSSSSSKTPAAPPAHNNVSTIIDHDAASNKKKGEKRRWLFGKSQSHRHRRQDIANNNSMNAEQRHAIAVAAATAATAEAAAATAQAAIEIVRLTSSSKFLKEVTLTAIVVIQTAFRGFLARKALRALKGLVKLQALVRGQNVRKQAKMTLQYIQALVRVQDQMRAQRARHSHEGGRRSSTSADSNTSWDHKLRQNASERRRTTFSGDVNRQLDNWDEPSRTLDEIDKMLHSRKKALMQREKALANAFSQQIQNSGRNISSRHKSDTGAEWLNRWMAEKQWESSRRSTDNNLMKTVEVDASKPNSHWHLPSSLQQINHQRPASPQRVASPRRRTHDFSFNYQSPATPSTPKIRPLQVRSASPRYFREEKSFSTTHTPKPSSAYRLHAEPLDGAERATAYEISALPNYMTATESAKAKTRSQSAPRIRPATPERERSGSVKKRLSYQPEEQARGSTTSMCGGMSQDLRSPSFKSYQDFSYGLEQQSNLSSYYTDSLAEEISPCSTTDLGRWLR